MKRSETFGQRVRSSASSVWSTRPPWSRSTPTPCSATEPTVLDTADVIIVGAGAIGCSIAYHLAERQAGRIVVLERDHIGSGSTSRGSGGVRLQFSTAINVQLSLLSVLFFQRFAERFGIDIDYQQRGYLFLAQDAEQLAALQRAVALQQRYGAPTQIVDPASIADIVAYLNVDDVVGGSYCRLDGRAEPLAVLGSLVTRARAQGVEIREGVAVREFRRRGERVAGVHTSAGPIDSPVVVNACGPWAADLAALAGVNEPVWPVRRDQFLTQPTDALPEPTPFIIDGDRHFSFHSLAGQIRVGYGSPERRDDWDASPDWTHVPRLLERIGHRVPALAQLKVASGYAGFYDMSPDEHPLVGWADQAPGLLLCNGFSGHGFMHSPAIGQLVAELIVDGSARTLDLFPLRPSRFEEGRLNHEDLAII